MSLYMDQTGYHYNYATDPVTGQPYLLNNRLNHITDQVAETTFSNDIDEQSTDNYQYDKIGNLIHDVQANLENIEWTVYGKIGRITKTNGDYIAYAYDPVGNRVSKTVGSGTDPNDVTKTWYVRDAQGNLLAV